MVLNKLKESPFGVKQASILLLSIIIVNFGLVKFGNVTISKAMQQELVHIVELTNQESPPITNQSPFTMKLNDIDELSRSVLKAKLDMIMNSPVTTDLEEYEVAEMEKNFRAAHDNLIQSLRHQQDLKINIINVAMWFTLILGLCYLSSILNFSFVAKNPVAIFSIIMSIRLLLIS